MCERTRGDVECLFGDPVAALGEDGPGVRRDFARAASHDRALALDG
ncbi:hypothetical protein [Streptomyces sp. ALB3]